jgi:hemolysin activation/secretion protein
MWSGNAKVVYALRKYLWNVTMGALTLGLSVMTAAALAEDRGEVAAFQIRGFAIEGNTVFDKDRLMETLGSFTGPGKTAEDVERARDALERTYHKAGYPAVLVNIPEQTVDDGIVRLVVIESKLGRIRVTGNRYFTMEKILKDLPSFRTGEILYVPDIQRDLETVNRSPDLKVAPVLMPGKELGTVDVELKVEDRLPLHGSLELSNRSSHDTTDLRLNALMRYDNLWQKDHSVSIQFQTSPEDRDEVQVLAGSYVLPSPFSRNHLVAVYGVWSDSDTAFGEGFQVVGKGQLIGGRYVMGLTGQGRYEHNVTLGLDYKDFDESVGFEGGEDTKTPITYMPLSFGYSASLPDASGVTRFSAGLNMAFRGLVTDQREFETKRYGARGNYIYVTGGVERTQKLPARMGLFLKVDGQAADQPLISNEQYSAGGMRSVRGYKESEELGDHAIHGTLELIGPDLADYFEFSKKADVIPYLFYDAASLKTMDPLPGQDQYTTLQGVGAGVRGVLTRYLEYEGVLGYSLSETDRTDRGETRSHFMVKVQF